MPGRSVPADSRYGGDPVPEADGAEGRDDDQHLKCA